MEKGKTKRQIETAYGESLQAVTRNATRLYLKKRHYLLFDKDAQDVNLWHYVGKCKTEDEADKWCRNAGDVSPVDNF